MKTMSIGKLIPTIILLYFFCMLNLTCLGQGGKRMEVRTIQMADSLKSRLTLTDAQYSKVLEITKKFGAGIVASRNPSDTKEQKATKLNGLAEQRAQALKAVLTKEQYAIFESYRKQEMKEFKDSGTISS